MNDSVAGRLGLDIAKLEQVRWLLSCADSSRLLALPFYPPALRRL